jgi:hypothetical protein
LRESFSIPVPPSGGGAARASSDGQTSDRGPAARSAVPAAPPSKVLILTLKLRE